MAGTSHAGKAVNTPVGGKYGGAITSAAQKHGIDPAFVNAVATQESGLGQASNNVMQVNGMENSAPEDSIAQGASMLGNYLKQTGSREWALAMYNMGPGILDWSKRNGYSNPRQAMPAFSRYQMQQSGSSGYGDPNYIDNVMRYYK